MELKEKKYVVAMSFANYLVDKSGMPKVMLAQQTEYNQNGIGYVALFSVKKNICHDKIMLFCKYGLIIDGEYRGIFQMSQIIGMIDQWSKQGHIWTDLHIHHLLYNNLNRVKELIYACNTVPIKVFLHDHYYACTRYNLINSSGSFCGAKGLNRDICGDCRYYPESSHKERQIHALFQSVQRRIIFIAPSESTKEIFLRYHPEYEEQIKVIPHQRYEGWYRDNLELIGPEDKIRVAYPARPQSHKGWDVWKKLVEVSSSDDYEFTVFNSTDDTYEGMSKVKIEFSKNNINAMAEAMRQNKTHIALLWALWAETYSYTCFEAYAANAFIITNEKSGNIAAVVKSEQNGCAFENESALIDFFRDPQRVRSIINQYRKETCGGPLKLINNDALIFDTISMKTEQSQTKCINRLVNAPLLYLLNRLYRTNKAGNK